MVVVVTKDIAARLKRLRGPAAALSCASLLLCAAPARAEPLLLDCTGAFAKTADEAALVKRFGRENVVAGTIGGPEGTSERGTIVFPKDPARRLEIVWHDGPKRRRPSTIQVRDGSSWAVKAPGASGRTIALGTRLGEVEEANGRPFTLSGFEWDYGGFVSSWKGGTLDHLEGGCSLSVRFDPDPKAGDKVTAKVAGDKDFSSSAPAMKAARPTVSQLSLGWAE